MLEIVITVSITAALDTISDGMLGQNKRTSDVFGISNAVLPDSYVDRGALDEALSKLLQRPTHVALRGASKCGKSWLRQRSVSAAIIVQCRLDRGVHDIYVDALSQLGVKLVLDDTRSGKISGHVKAEASIGEGLIAKVLGASAAVKAGIEDEQGTETRSGPIGHNVRSYCTTLRKTIMKQAI